LLEIAHPGPVTGDAPTPTNSVSGGSLGDRTYGSSPGYPILFPLASSSGTLTAPIPGFMDGITLLNPPLAYEASNTLPHTAALSLFDFNLFRGNVIQAIDILDQKIRDILDVLEPTCPS